MSSSLARLRFIHYAGWIVFGELPGRKPAGWRTRPSLLFISDYDGDQSEYLAAFGLTVSPGMRWTFGSADGFPGPQPTRRFIEYVERHCFVERLRYAAYPGATVRDVDAALAVADRIDELRRMPESVDDARFDEAFGRLLDALARSPEPVVPSLLSVLLRTFWRRSSVKGLTVVMPIEPGRKAEVVAAIDALAVDPATLFEAVGGIHFARLVTIDVEGRRSRIDRPPVTPPDHLLFSTWFDGPADAFVDRLVSGLGEQAGVIWSRCSGYPGTTDPAALAAWIKRHRLRCSLFLGSRSGVSVEQIREALDLREQAMDVVTAVQGRPLADIRRELKTLWQ